MTIMEMPARVRSAARSSGECLVARVVEPLALSDRTSSSRAQSGFWAERPETRIAPARATQRRLERNTPLQSLAGGSLASRFHAWSGGSGRRYVCSVFAVDSGDPESGLPDYTEVIILAVARDETGTRQCVSVFLRGATADLVAQRQFVAAALAAGAVEWHVHLLVADAQQRRLVANDILSAHAPEASNVG
jgi:hypothetical protein